MAEFSSQRPRPHSSRMRVTPASWCSTSAQRLPVSPLPPLLGFPVVVDRDWGKSPKGRRRRCPAMGRRRWSAPFPLLLPLLLPSLLAGAVGIERENSGGGGTGSCGWGWNLKGRSARV
jgi:hypothetical protein